MYKLKLTLYVFEAVGIMLLFGLLFANLNNMAALLINFFLGASTAIVGTVPGFF